jgi:RimJ/RimL family protein N-acetyltransferase
MNISLKKFTAKDLQAHESWRHEIGASQYMSRLYPRAFNGKDVKDLDLYMWYVIVADNADIGTIWLEKNKPHDTVVTLGILIGKRDKLGIGIGRKVIPLAIRQANQTLDFEAVRLDVRKANVRAIACYKYCGFTIVREGIKVNPEGEEIPFFEMYLPLANLAL